MRVTPLRVFLAASAAAMTVVAFLPPSEAGPVVAPLRFPLFFVFLGIALTAWPLALWAASRGGPPRVRSIASALVTGVAAFPLGVTVGWLAVSVRAWAGPGAALGGAIAGWLALWAAALADRGPRAEALATVALATAGVIALVTVLDALLARGLATEMVFGYDPGRRMRLYGVGNEMASLLVGSLLAGLGLFADRGVWSARAGGRAVAAAGAAALVVAAAPFLGANVGALAWGGVAFAAAAWGIAGHRLTWRHVLRGLAAGIVLAALFAWADSLRTVPTHIGKVWLEFVGQEWWTLSERISGRWGYAWQVFTYAPLGSAAVCGVFALLVKVRFAPGRVAGPLWDTHSAMRAMLDAVLLAAPVALLVEDSGITVPVLVMVLPVCALLVTALDSAPAAPRLAEEDPA